MPPKKHRNARICPVCLTAVRKPTQHVRSVHKISRYEALTLTKNAEKAPHTDVVQHERSKSGRHRWMCKTHSCSSTVINRGRHLVKVHQLRKGEPDYKRAMVAFKMFTVGDDSASDIVAPSLPDLDRDYQYIEEDEQDDEDDEQIAEQLERDMERHLGGDPDDAEGRAYFSYRDNPTSKFQSNGEVVA